MESAHYGAVEESLLLDDQEKNREGGDVKCEECVELIWARQCSNTIGEE